MIADWNGNLIPSDNACLPVSGPPTCTSAGVYETIRTYDGRPYGLEDHLARMSNGCSLLGLKPELDPEKWKARIEVVLRENNFGAGEGRLRLLVMTGWEDKPAQTGILLWPLDQVALDRKRESGMAVIFSSLARSYGFPLYRIKSLSLAPTHMAQAEAAVRGAQDAIILNTRGEVCESTYANVLMITRSGRLVTPSDDSPCLPGITIRTVCVLARQHGFDFDIRPIKREELFEAAEVLLCSSVSEIVPVTKLEGKSISGAQPGPMGRLLQQKFREFVKASLVSCA